MKKIATIASSVPEVRGFYLMERDEAPGEFEEFWEFADEDAARRFEANREARLGDAGRERLVSMAQEEAASWRQRL